MKTAAFIILAAVLVCTHLAFSVDIIASDPCLSKIQWGYFSGGKVYLVSSSHQDIAWLDTPAQCEINRDIHTITPALEIMKKEPNYYFCMEQALNLKEYLQRHPERKEELQQRAKEKRFTWGATYVQPYESVESGEELVRQVYFGRRWIKQILPDANERVAYNVDVPGRAMQMPQIFKKAGIDYLVISRQKEGVFNWQSPDGSRVGVFSSGHYMENKGYDCFRYGVNETVVKISNRLNQWNNYYHEHNLPPVHCFYISADGTAPVDYSQLCRKWNDIAAEFNKVSPANNKMPQMKHTTMADFMDMAVNSEAKLDTISGERPNLWLYIHGPTHHWAISAKRKAGVLLPAAEKFATISAIVSNDFAGYPQSQLSKAWESAIYPDHGWGGENGDITDEVFKKKYEFARDSAAKILTDSLSCISSYIKTKGKGRPVIVFNDLSWPRDGIVKFSPNALDGDFIIKDGSGREMPSQSTGQIRYFVARDMPPIGYKTYYLFEKPVGPQLMPQVGQVCQTYENNYFKVLFSAGGLKSIVDKQTKRQLVRTDKFLAGEVFSMRSVGNGAGEFLKVQQPSMKGFDRGANHPAKWVITQSGDIREVLETKYSFADCNIVERVIFYKQFKKIDFEVEINGWAARHNRELRMAFPLDMPKGEIAYEVPMGIVRVGKDEMAGSPGGWTKNGVYDQNAAEIHPREVQNFMMAYNADFGIMLSGSVAVWDYIDPTANQVDYPVLQPLLLATRKSCHGKGKWYEQKGDHSYSFSFMPYQPQDKHIWQRGIEANHSLYAAADIEQNKKAYLPAEKSFFSVSAKNVVISAIKKCEDDNSVVVRVYEIEGHAAYPVLKVPFKILAAEHTNIIEENGNPLPSNADSLKIRVGKYAIETFKLLRQQD